MPVARRPARHRALVGRRCRWPGGDNEPADFHSPQGAVKAFLAPSRPKTSTV